MINSAKSIESNINRITNNIGDKLSPINSFSKAINALKKEGIDVSTSNLPISIQSLITESAITGKPIESSLSIYSMNSELSNNDKHLSKIGGKFKTSTHGNQTLIMNIPSNSQTELPENFLYRIQFKLGNTQATHTGVYFANDNDYDESNKTLVSAMYNTEKYKKYKKHNLPTAVLAIHKKNKPFSKSTLFDGASVFVSFNIASEPKKNLPGIGKIIGEKMDTLSKQTIMDKKIGASVSKQNIDDVESIFNGLLKVLVDRKVSTQNSSMAVGYHHKSTNNVSDFHMAKSENCEEVELVWGSMSSNFITLSVVAALKALGKWNQVADERLVEELLSDSRGKSLKKVLNSVYNTFYASRKKNGKIRTLPTITELLLGTTGLVYKKPDVTYKQEKILQESLKNVTNGSLNDTANDTNDLMNDLGNDMYGYNNVMNDYSKNSSKTKFNQVKSNELEFIEKMQLSGELSRYPSSNVDSDMQPIESAILSFIIVRLAKLAKLKFDGTPEQAFIKFVNMFSGDDNEFDNVIIGIGAGTEQNTITPNNVTSLYNAGIGVASSFCDLEYFVRLWVDKYKELQDVLSYSAMIPGTKNISRVLGWEYTQNDNNNIEFLFQVGGIKRSNITYLMWAHEYGMWCVINIKESTNTIKNGKSIYDDNLKDITKDIASEFTKILNKIKDSPNVTNGIIGSTLALPYNVNTLISARNSKNISTNISEKIGNMLDSNSTYTSSIANPILSTIPSIKFESSGKYGILIDSNTKQPITKFVYDNNMGSFTEINGTNEYLGQTIQINKDSIDLHGIRYSKGNQLKYSDDYKNIIENPSILQNSSSSSSIDSIFDNTDDSEKISGAFSLLKSQSDLNKPFKVKLFDESQTPQSIHESYRDYDDDDDDDDDDDFDFDDDDDDDDIGNQLQTSSSSSSSSSNSTQYIGNRRRRRGKRARRRRGRRAGRRRGRRRGYGGRSFYRSRGRGLGRRRGYNNFWRRRYGKPVRWIRRGNRLLPYLVLGASNALANALLPSPVYYHPYGYVQLLPL